MRSPARHGRPQLQEQVIRCCPLSLHRAPAHSYHAAPFPTCHTLGGNEMRGALSQDAEAANATLDGMTACIETSLRSLIDSGETRIAVGM